MEELWIPVKLYEELYEISNLGRIRSNGKFWKNKCGTVVKSKPKILTQRVPERCVHIGVNLSKNKKWKCFKVYKLVGEHFLEPKINNKAVVVFKTNNFTDTSINNLAWGDRVITSADSRKKVLDSFVKNTNTVEILLENCSGIYRIINIINNKCYIGSSKHIFKRLSNHFALLKLNNHHCNKLQRSYNKYGEGNFKVEIIEKCEEVLLEKREQEICDIEKPFFNEATIRRKGFDFMSEETKKKISKTHIDRYNALTEEQRNENRLKRVKKYIENGAVFKKEKNPNKTDNIEDNRKFANYNLWRKPINQYDLEGNFIKEWNSIKEAHEETGRGDITGCCKGRKLTANGYIWKYADITNKKQLVEIIERKCNLCENIHYGKGLCQKHYDMQRSKRIYGLRKTK